MLFCGLCVFFCKINFFKKSVRNTIRVLPGLIWLQVVCKGYQQTIKVATSGGEGLGGVGGGGGVGVKATAVDNFFFFIYIFQKK